MNLNQIESLWEMYEILRLKDYCPLTVVQKMVNEGVSFSLVTVLFKK